MFLKRLSLRNFRNIKDCNIEPSLINIIVGENAQGKTNFIEGIFFLAKAASFRTNTEEEIINWKEKEMQIKGEIEEEGINFNLSLSKGRGREKKVWLGPKEVRRAYEISNRIKVIYISSEDVNIIGGEPEGRRRYLDLAISPLKPPYYYLVREYYHTLRQRNSLLKEIKETYLRLPKVDRERGRNFKTTRVHSSSYHTLFAYEESLSKLGSKIMMDRKQFIEQISPKVEYFYQKLISNSAKLHLLYKPSFDGAACELSLLKDKFLMNLNKIREEEIRKGMTLIGPHRDDFKFILNEVDLRIYGSSGEKMSAGIVLKQAEVDLVKEKTGKMPILLFDDFQSFLDNERIKRVIDLLITTNEQIFMSTTSLTNFPQDILNSAKIYRIHQGNLTLISSEAHKVVL